MYSWLSFKDYLNECVAEVIAGVCHDRPSFLVSTVVLDKICIVRYHKNRGTAQPLTRRCDMARFTQNFAGVYDKHSFPARLSSALNALAVLGVLAFALGLGYGVIQ